MPVSGMLDHAFAGGNHPVCDTLVEANRFGRSGIYFCSVISRWSAWDEIWDKRRVFVARSGGGRDWRLGDGPHDLDVAGSAKPAGDPAGTRGLARGIGCLARARA